MILKQVSFACTTYVLQDAGRQMVDPACGKLVQPASKEFKKTSPKVETPWATEIDAQVSPAATWYVFEQVGDGAAVVLGTVPFNANDVGVE